MTVSQFLEIIWAIFLILVAVAGVVLVAVMVIGAFVGYQVPWQVIQVIVGLSLISFSRSV